MWTEMRNHYGYVIAYTNRGLKVYKDAERWAQVGTYVFCKEPWIYSDGRRVGLYWTDGDVVFRVDVTSPGKSVYEKVEGAVGAVVRTGRKIETIFVYDGAVFWQEGDGQWRGDESVQLPFGLSTVSGARDGVIVTEDGIYWDWNGIKGSLPGVFERCGTWSDGVWVVGFGTLFFYDLRGEYCGQCDALEGLVDAELYDNREVIQVARDKVMVYDTLYEQMAIFSTGLICQYRADDVRIADVHAGVQITEVLDDIRVAGEYVYISGNDQTTAFNIQLRDFSLKLD